MEMKVLYRALATNRLILIYIALVVTLALLVELRVL